ncbi:MAG: DNA mismatch repair endonuclease MutL [Paludibacteraceae bacterium]|nr:DNA mismatch repair endonuclease MutL [Paludibacteraceae bacterium]MBQ8714966.1 DNA mismatch repair endonuclease MutL [Prevotella sp.]
MSDVIQLLPDSVANQIAAGEVIQRPASVIKELVENAVDAGAHTIRVLVVDAGRTSIQVIDDGKGMSETDARLAFERHATSKIRKADDLFALTTMGFRGEALPSIAAVAQVELRTRTEDNELGTCLRLSGSKVEEQEPVSCPVGSNFKVENLFFNVPARRKFLKTNATELNNILTAFERIVLVYPEINFSIHSNGQELLNLKSGTLRQRIADVFGKRFNQDLLEVKVETAICKITGFVGKPESAKKKGAHDYFFVNGRFMKHAYFHKAVMQAFERLVPVGMQIPYFIYFEVAPADIDVNIHPTKTEIKFENEQAIWQILLAAVKDAIGKFCEVPQIDFDTEGQPDIPVFNPVSPQVEIPAPSYNPSYNPFKQHQHAERPKKVYEGWEQLYDQLPQQSQQPPVEIEAFDVEEKSPMHYQYKGRYIMTAVKSGLMIIDQYRADVRIRYERYLSQLESQTVNSQRMLFPEVVQFSPSDAVMLEKILPELTAMGFDLSDLGQFSYGIQAIPAGLEGLNYVRLVQDMVSDTIEKGTGSLHDIHSSLALSLARHAAIPQGQILNNEEMENIINELFACSNVNYTPDGKAILCILPQRDIEQLLG